MALTESKLAPAFSLSGSDGKTHKLSDYSGKTVIIYFYPKDDTPGCTKEACGFRDAHAALKKNNVVVLGVSKDDIDSHSKFIEKFQLPFVLLSDPDTNMMQAYGAWGEKTNYGKTTMGTIRSTVVIGPDGKVLKHWPTVRNAEEHPAEVIEFLQGRSS